MKSFQIKSQEELQIKILADRKDSPEANDKNLKSNETNKNTLNNIDNLLIELDSNTLYKGLLYAEIFGKPMCKRKRRWFKLIKILIADDEPGMRLIIKKFLSKNKKCEIIGEAANGEEVVYMVGKFYPDVVFMDIDMPILNGIEAAKRILDIKPKIKIVFATAHEGYMADAFELYAFDYLVKPFKIARIEKTLQRILDIELDKNIVPVYERPNRLVSDKLMIKNKEGINFIDIEDIILIQREDRLTVIYTKSNKYHTSEGLSELEEKLDKTIFLRSHKSYIINLLKINKIQHYGRWTYLVNFKGTEQDALITSTKFEILENMFKG